MALGVEGEPAKGAEGAPGADELQATGGSRSGTNIDAVAAFLANPITPDRQIFSIGVPIPDEIAKVPVARLWDTDRYDGTNPDVTLSTTIGLAEYTNANFFSDNTIQ